MIKKIEITEMSLDMCQNIQVHRDGDLICLHKVDAMEYDHIKLKVGEARDLIKILTSYCESGKQ